MMAVVATNGPDLVRALDDGVAPTPPTVGPGFDGVIAVDHWKRWAAVFTLSIAPSGHWWSDIHLFQAAERGWQAMTAGGSHGSEWNELWRPEVHEPSLLEPHQWGGQDAEHADGSDVRLVAVGGYAAPSVTSIAVRQGDETRMVPVIAALNAFVILGPAGQRAVMAIGIGGVELAPARIVSCD